MSVPQFIPLKFTEYSKVQMQQRAEAFHALMHTRRTVRDFSNRSVPQSLIETCIQTASTAPSGANKQPWHFVAVSDPEIKQQIRTASEKEKREFYTQRAPDRWLNDLAPLMNVRFSSSSLVILHLMPKYLTSNANR